MKVSTNRSSKSVEKLTLTRDHFVTNNTNSLNQKLCIFAAFQIRHTLQIKPITLHGNHRTGRALDYIVYNIRLVGSKLSCCKVEFMYNSYWCAN